MTHRANYVFGLSTAFTSGAFVDFLVHLNWMGFLSFVGAAASTGYGWYLTERGRKVAADLQLDAMRAESVRQRQLADLILLLTKDKVIDAARASDPHGPALQDQAPAAQPP